MRKAHVGRLPLKPILSAVLLLIALGAVGTVALPAAATPALQSQCFSETRFCIEEPAFQHYFANRGGARILGFPESRAFDLEGFRVQFFQRVVLQLHGNGVARLNLLDPGVLPVRHANQSTFLSPDAGLAAEAPPPDVPGVSAARRRVSGGGGPDTWNTMPVGFSALFNNTVPAEGVSPEIRTLLNLEIWGLPTSKPAADPGNADFVYQRFQRGIMHFRAGCGCTEGILVGDYLKAVLTGRNLPDDLASDMRSDKAV